MGCWQRNQMTIHLLKCLLFLLVTLSVSNSTVGTPLYSEDEIMKRHDSGRPWQNAFLRQQRHSNNFFRSTKRGNIEDPRYEEDMKNLAESRRKVLEDLYQMGLN